MGPDSDQTNNSIDNQNVLEQPILTSPSAQPPPKRTVWQKLGHVLGKFWLTLIACLTFVGLIGWFVQPARWWVVNTLGARNTLTITTISPGEGDKAKLSQLKHVAVTIDGKTYHTDDNGKLQATGVRYGTVDIVAHKPGYQDVHDGVTLDFDPFFYKFGGKAQDDAVRSIELSLTATGIPVAFKVVDAFSGKPVTVGEFTIGDVVAKPDDQGQVSLKIPGTDEASVSVRTGFGGAYVDKTFAVSLGAPSQTISVVPGGRHYFISKRTGVLSVYSCNLDGSDVQPIVVGTGQETDATVFSVSPSGKYAVLSSSRDGARNAHQDLLQRMYVVDLASKQLTRVDEGTGVAFADWSGDTLAYSTTSYDAPSNASQSTLKSVDTTNHRVYNVESADAIDIRSVAFDKIAYLKYNNAGPDQPASPVLRVAPTNNTSAKTLGEKIDLSSYMQLDFDRVAFRTVQDQAWHEYNFNTDQLKTISQPATSTSQQFLSTANASGSQRLLVDRIDGKYTLIVKDTATGAMRQLYGAKGLDGPIRWLGNVIVYRVVDSDEAADYAISLDGGDPHKIADVTAAARTEDAAVDQQFRFY